MCHLWISMSYDCSVWAMLLIQWVVIRNFIIFYHKLTKHLVDMAMDVIILAHNFLLVIITVIVLEMVQELTSSRYTCEYRNPANSSIFWYCGLGWSWCSYRWRGDDSDSDAPNDAYESGEIEDSGSDHDVRMIANRELTMYNSTHNHFIRRTIHFCMILGVIQRCLHLPVSQRVFVANFRWMIMQLLLSLECCSLVKNKDRLKSAVKLWSLGTNREFKVLEAKIKSWTIHWRVCWYSVFQNQKIL